MALKRFTDIVLSFLLLVLSSPLLVLISLAIWLDSGRPVLFRQKRLGLNLRAFDILKFRTMHVAPGGPALTVGNDARITRVGRWLRSTKLDELPQLWNVLRGEMSLVGPRPEVPCYVEMYRQRYARILTLLPGITDLASIRFRREAELLAGSADPLREYAEYVLPAKLDLAEQYLHHRSFLLDLSILWRTAIVGARAAAATIFSGPFGLCALRLKRKGLVRRSSILLIHLLVFAFSVFTAFLLRFEFAIPAAEKKHLEIALAVSIAVKLVAFRIAGLDRGWWRFFSIYDVARLLCANTVASAAAYLTIAVLTPGFPRSLPLLDLLVCFLATGAVRAVVRVMIETAGEIQKSSPGKRVLIYGAGTAGQALLREIRSNPELAYTVLGFIDDNPQKQKLHILGVQVAGSGSDLPRLGKSNTIDEVLIAVPSADGRQMAAMVEHCRGAKIACRTIPGLSELVENHGLIRQIRDVAVEDLLGRAPVRLQHADILAKISGKVVFVSGAAGSIGSELCQQIARFQPRCLVAFDIAETAVFDLQQEIRGAFPSLDFRPEIGSVQNVQRVRELFERYHPSLVYHAAAYKHVPLMEAHVFEAVENNVIGTFNIASAASDCAVEDFVMISSDKAVRPTNIMGATKRVAELVIRSLQNGGTRFVSVRFGNVLGSSGSVIPTFKRQIAAGGPVTVTHPEMRRYFMIIPEAAQLVLQASTMGKGGEIFVLDMGQPVRIVDLARQLILLSGLRPDEDIRIQFTGIRPGEKLFEELNIDSESALPTCHEKVRIFAGAGLPARDAFDLLARLRGACRKRDLADLILAIKGMVPDYNPSRELLEEMISPGLRNLAAAVSAHPVTTPSPLPRGLPEELPEHV